MLKKLGLIVRVKELRNKILFVLLMLMIFRAIAAIPVPGVDVTKLKSFFESNQLFGLISVFTGGAFDNFSLAMIGLSPYITATIIMQLLTMIFPKLEALYKEEGEAGRQKFNQYSRLLTVPLAILQSFGMIKLLQSSQVIGYLTVFQLLVAISAICGGTIFIMWLGELISEKGIGNGVSLLIFAGIVSRLPATFNQTIATWNPAKVPSYIGFALLAVLVVAAVVLITEGRRNIPVSYAKRIRGSKMYGGVSTYLPLNVNPAGVIPIIFALSIMLFPGMVASFFISSSVGWLASLSSKITQVFNNQGFIYATIYFILVLLFTYFYTAVTFDPKNVSENLQKMGGFVPGIRPGRPTADFLKLILNRVLLVGAVFLGLIAVLPTIIQQFSGVSTLTIGGTAILIVVAVVLETIRQIDAQLVMRDYEGL
ncbi:MAG: preprotein translocase subunit SecY [Candidatus Portnoybacteria bacterium CG10_big_fil_rev_8_21_14_0_10_36_7]|uniref:Protein translocase subunit SecY n=1 Tax=Candidatus Portnoybacteria bacterium CG10_big_fil_rev_8_21_14_0_10_36_7 TaxID=1974812 RepID=A0A2M8KDA1_9BACT|nr:MAG: preprotein translocase subunit SecY [Candidatus Portnoybacteria bacterium CG10_big_fil_rev_8_21_14_0_10_36_7]